MSKIAIEPVVIKMFRNENGDFELKAEKIKFKIYYINQEDFYGLMDSPVFYSIKAIPIKGDDFDVFSIDGYVNYYDNGDLITMKLKNILETEDRVYMNRINSFFDNIKESVFDYLKNELSLEFSSSKRTLVKIDIDFYKHVEKLVNNLSPEFNKMIKQMKNEDRGLFKTIA